ncbi:MAG: hypothetical protein NC132_00435 [Corallococcus sp.]|nr:hypothetical protein [Corallococcus sp.]MCM1359191.1 hypothetical protein [Corallococcus sp.]MCM1394581.1 hypothetical protein [Corallococcus sp.]
MYIWIGIDVDDPFDDMRKRAMEAEAVLGCEHSCYTLPMHVSLKMSFEISEDRFEDIESSLIRFFEKQKPVQLTNPRLENAGNIVWIRYDENSRLNEIKDELNAMLSEKYEIPLHEYDKDYLHHTTVFMFDDDSSNAEGFTNIKNVPLPKKVTANKFVLGISPNGKLGTFIVKKTIAVG